MFKQVSKNILGDIRRDNAIKTFQQPRKPFKDIFKDWLKDKVVQFCEVTSLHGYVHTVKKEYKPYERYIWILLSISALITAIILLWISWSWAAKTPTTTVIESTNFPTYNLQFPSITICNINKISKPDALKVVKDWQRPNNMSDDELVSRLQLLLHFSLSGNATNAQYQEVNDILETNNQNINYLLELLSPSNPCDDMIARCRWKGSLMRCDSLFQMVNTSEGVCCSFNNHAYPYANYNPKVLASVPKDPRRVTSCGYQTGLTVLLRTQTESYVGTVIASGGFKMMIHDAYNFPDSNAVTKLVPEKSEAYVSITPEATFSTDDIFSLEPEIRECLRYNERRMDIFSRYTYVNCMAECRSAIVNAFCGCVPYNLPNNGTFTKCKLKDLKCVKDNAFRFSGSTFKLNNDSSENSRYLRTKCQCFPDCNFYSYPGEAATGTINRDFSYNALSFFKDINLTDHSLVHVYFVDLTSTKYRKDMYQNWLGILAAFGGLLGLFLGFSIVTGFEFVYFFTIRTLFDKLAARKHAPEKPKTTTTSQEATKVVKY